MSQQNGISKCNNRMMMESARFMLYTTNFLNSFWTNAIARTCYIQNQAFFTTLGVSKTPLTLWSGQTLDISHMWVFGSPIYVRILDEK